MKTLLRQLGALVRLSFLDLWRRHDVWALIVLALALLAPLSAAKPFGASGATRYLDEAALLLIWVFSLVVSMACAARLFPPEFSSRTVYALFAKPVSRARILAGKYLGALFASWSALAFFYLLFAAAGAARGAGWSGGDLAQAFALHLAAVALIVAMMLLGTLVFTPSAAYAIVGATAVSMFFFGGKLPQYAASASRPLSWIIEAVNAFAPHLEFFDMRQRVIHGWGGVSAGVMAIVLAYAAFMILACLAICALALSRKKL